MIRASSAKRYARLHRCPYGFKWGATERMSEPARKPNPKFPRRVRRICLLLVIAGIVAALCGYYVWRHLPDVMVALVRRAAPNLSLIHI